MENLGRTGHKLKLFLTRLVKVKVVLLLFVVDGEDVLPVHRFRVDCFVRVVSEVLGDDLVSQLNEKGLKSGLMRSVYSL